MSSYKELLKQREALELQISNARRDEVANAIAQVRTLVDEYALTQQEVFPTTRARSTTSGTKVAPKYRDPATGQTGFEWVFERCCAVAVISAAGIIQSALE